MKLSPCFIIEDSAMDQSTFIFLAYNNIDNGGVEQPQLVTLDIVSVSDIQEENHKIALERVNIIKHALVVNTSQILGGRINV